MIQANNPGTILQCVQQFGPSIGARKMLEWEFKHAKEAIDSQIYVTYRSSDKESCMRIGSFSRCFCGHLFKVHNKQVGKKLVTNCKDCDCKHFEFVPRRPEEVGQWWLVRRKGFDVTKWKALCKCKHDHTEHKPNEKKCKKCSCFRFMADFCCVSCEKKQEEHQTIYETEEERKMLKLPVQVHFMPLVENRDILQSLAGQLQLGEDIFQYLSGKGLFDMQKYQAERKEIEEKGNEGEVKLKVRNDDGRSGEVNLVIKKQETYTKKNDFKNPERSVQLMNKKPIVKKK